MISDNFCGGRALRITIGITILLAFIRKGICVGIAGAPTLDDGRCFESVKMEEGT